jgi:hypothetical protein
MALWRWLGGFHAVGDERAPPVTRWEHAVKGRRLNELCADLRRRYRRKPHRTMYARQPGHVAAAFFYTFLNYFLKRKCGCCHGAAAVS